MYQKYHTEALVLGSRESGEADRAYALYTKDFGLVRARASAVRTEGSRMRYALQSYSRAYVALVRGKRGWRIAGAASSRVSGKDAKSVRTFARIGRLLLRLVAGEEKNEFLYASVAHAHALLMQENCEPRATVELVCIARMLFALGYLSAEAHASALFTHTAYTGESLLEAETMRDKLLSSVNHAISETHL